MTSIKSPRSELGFGPFTSGPVRQAAPCLARSRQNGAILSIYQNLEIFAHFTAVLGFEGWVSSLAAGEFKRLNANP